MAEKRPAWFKVYAKDAQLFQGESDAVVGKAFKAALSYLSDGVLPIDLKGSQRTLFHLLKSDIEDATVKYDKRCRIAEKARTVGNKGKRPNNRLISADNSLLSEEGRRKKEEGRIPSSLSEEGNGDVGNDLSGHSATPSEESEIMIVDGEVFDLVFDPELGRKRRVRRRKDDGATN